MSRSDFDVVVVGARRARASLATFLARSAPRGPSSLTLLLVAAIGGCESGGRPDPGVATRDSAGVAIVESEGPAWEEGEAWRPAPEPGVSIGVVDGEAVYQLDRVREAASAPDGRIVVANGGSSEIRVYDPSGRHLVSFGGPGEGPGEFKSLGSMVLLGDTVAVFDEAAGRLTYFDLSGTLLGTTRFEGTGDPIHPLRMYALGGGVADGFAMLVRAFPADMRPEPVTYWDTLPTLRYSRDGAVVDTIGEFAGMDTHSTPRRSGSILFARYSSADVHDGLLYMSDGGRYEVRVHDPRRGLVRILRVLVEPRPVGAALLEEYGGRMMERLDDPERRRELEEHLASWPHAEMLPWISAILVDRGGRVWAREYRPPFDPSPVAWGVFDAGGRWLGRVEMPAAFRPTEIGPDFVLGIERDELGVEYVRRYELRRGDR